MSQQGSRHKLVKPSPEFGASRRSEHQGFQPNQFRPDMSIPEFLHSFGMQAQCAGAPKRRPRPRRWSWFLDG